MTDILLSRLGHQLRQQRVHRGLTQAQAAELARMPREKVVRMEQGRGTVALEAYVALAHALGAELALVPARRPTIEEVTQALGNG